jgi:hypothetical protein
MKISGKIREMAAENGLPVLPTDTPAVVPKV